MRHRIYPMSKYRKSRATFSGHALMYRFTSDSNERLAKFIDRVSFPPLEVRFVGVLNRHAAAVPSSRNSQHVAPKSHKLFF
jgi:hypothetical protein